MGQHVSVDTNLVDLNTFLGSARAELPTLLGAASDARVRHHLKAWRFRMLGRSVSATSMPLHTHAHFFSADLDRASSYLILHSHAVGDEATQNCSLDFLLGLKDFAAQATATCTPRGLTMNVVSQCEAWTREDVAVRISVFVWHGVNADTQVKARALTKAFELESALRSNVSQRPQQPTPNRSAPDGAIVLQGVLSERRLSDGLAAGDETAARDMVHETGNQLLSSILGSLPGASSAGAKRYPRLGRSVCRSLGVSPAHSLPGKGNISRQTTQQEPPVRPSSAPQQISEGDDDLSTDDELPAPPPLARFSQDSRPRGPTIPPLGGPAVPRLQLNMLGLGSSVRSDSSMDVEGAAADPPCSGRKRGRGTETERRPDAVGSALAAAATGFAAPKSARTEHSETPRKMEERVEEKGEGERCVVPGVRRAEPRKPLSIPLTLGASPQRPVGVSPISSKADSPVTLNLEEIAMSEEELIQSYDPDNEENNYHLPNHLRKQLQLRQYRQVCCEVVPGALYISSYQVACDLECLQRHGITHIVNTAADICDNCFPDQFKYMTYYLKDSNSEDLSPLFYRTLDWIQSAVSGGGRVLVHCKEGVSRSATFVIAYLMWRFSMPLDKAHDAIRKTRPICNPNAGFTYRLILLGKKLGVGGCGNQSPACEQKAMFRVVPHNAKQPFLLLSPVEWPTKFPALDPRFGWVIQRGLKLILWLGSAVPTHGPVEDAVAQHVAWVATFERTQLTYSVVHEGGETPEVWQALDLLGPAGTSRQLSSGAAAAFNGDFEILCGPLLPSRGCVAGDGCRA